MEKYLPILDLPRLCLNASARELLLKYFKGPAVETTGLRLL
jgi:hypothetical protein